MKFKLLVVLFITMAVSLSAQRYMTILSYNTALPMGKTGDFVSEYSWRGFAIEGRRFVQKNLSIGINFGWNIFDEKNGETIELDNGAVSGTQIRYLNVFPIMVNAHYYFGDKRSFRGFLGVNVGTYAINQRFDIGIWTINNDNWHFGVAPEIGILIPAGRQMAVTLSVKYNYALSAGAALDGSDSNDHSYLGINLGLAFDY